MFEIRDPGPMKFFLGVRVIRNFQQETVSSVQDTYREKLIKDYDLDIVKKAPSTPLPGEIEVYDGEVDPARVHLYKKVGSIATQQ